MPRLPFEVTSPVLAGPVQLDTSHIKGYIRIDATFRTVITVSAGMGDHEEVYFISMAARLLGMHPQTLRKYERLGLVQPSRTIGSMRLYSRDELDRLKVIKHLVGKGGVNLAGVQRLLSIAEVVERIRPLIREDGLSARDGRRRLVQELDEIARMHGLD